MKKLFFICLCFVSVRVFGQVPKDIEADLLKSFKRINYWDEKQRSGSDIAVDSLEMANDVFGAKLKKYTEAVPSTINEPLLRLKKEGLNIFTSADNLFRIYSWETWMGGTMRDFANVMQYKAGEKTKSVLLTSNEDNYIPFYSNLYIFKVNGKTYYFGIYNTIYSAKDAGTGIRFFTIENGKLNNDVRLIKTQSGLKSKIYYDYDFFSVVNIKYELRPTITFDATTQTIRIPLVADKGKMTDKFITYKFTGQYFEKVKN